MSGCSEVAPGVACCYRCHASGTTFERLGSDVCCHAAHAFDTRMSWHDGGASSKISGSQEGASRTGRTGAAPALHRCCTGAAPASAPVEPVLDR